MVVSKLHFVLRCTASGTWCCAWLASSECRVIFVSEECHCSPLNILESREVAERERRRKKECHTTSRKWQASTCFVAEWQVNGQLRRRGGGGD